MKRVIACSSLLLCALTQTGCVAPVVSGPYYRPDYPLANRVGTPTLQSAVLPLAVPFKKPSVGDSVHEGTNPANVAGAWIVGTPAQRLRFRHGDCYMEVRADLFNKGVLFKWGLERLTGCDNALSIQQAPVIIEDLDTGQKVSPKVFSRSFLAEAPGIPTSEPVNLLQRIPGFRDVPANLRTYLVSIEFTRY